MRILMIAQFYPPTIGGEEQHLRSLSQELAARDHSVAVATLWQEGLDSFEMDGKVRIYRIPGVTQRMPWLYKESERRHAPPFPDPEVMLHLQQVISQEQPEIVHAHNWMVYSFLPLKAWSRTRLVVTLHDYSLLCPQKRLMNRFSRCSGPGFVKCLACASKHFGPLKGAVTAMTHRQISVVLKRKTDMFLPVSRAVADGNGLEREQLPYRVISNMIPDEKLMNEAESYVELEELPQEDFLLYVGDLSRDKGVHILLRAYAQLVNAPPLVLIGRLCGDTPTEIPPNVKVLGSWPHGAVMAAWRRALLGIIPSIWSEPFGIVALEAMSVGCPLIVSKVGGLAEIVVHGETGLLTPPGDVVVLKRAITRLMTDSDLRAEMSRNGKNRATDFRAEAIIQRVEQVYQNMLANAPVSVIGEKLEQKTGFLGYE